MLHSHILCVGSGNWEMRWQVLPLKTEAKQSIRYLSFFLVLYHKVHPPGCQLINTSAIWGCQQDIPVSLNVGRGNQGIMKDTKVPLSGCIFPLPPAPSLAVLFAKVWCRGCRGHPPRLDMSSKEGSCSQKDMSETPHKKRVATIFARITALASSCLLKL